MNSLVTVIIPIFNGDNYIKTSLDSVLSQTYKNLDIIVINDGSTDNTDVICKAYEKKDSRIRYFSQSNGGVSSARNVGLENAKGKYICFLDADDFYNPKFVEILLSGMKDEKSVISACDISMNHELASIEKSWEFHNYSIEKAFYEMCKNGIIHPYIWNKMFLFDVIKANNLRFDTNLIYGEDTSFMLQYYACAYEGNIMYAKNLLLYHHIINPDSVMMKRKKKFSKNWFHQLEALDKAVEYAQKRNLYDFAKRISIRKTYIYSVILNLFIISGYKGKEYKEILNELRDNLPEFLKSDLFDKKIKRQMKICAKSPKIKYYFAKFKLI